MSPGRFWRRGGGGGNHQEVENRVRWWCRHP